MKKRPYRRGKNGRFAVGNCGGPGRPRSIVALDEESFSGPGSPEFIADLEREEAKLHRKLQELIDEE